MLDKQFFNNSSYQTFLKDNFILLYYYEGDYKNRPMFTKFNVFNTPTILIMDARGIIIKKLNFYSPPPESFKNLIAKAIKDQKQ